MRALFVLLISMALVGCNRPDPNPEKRDPIYLDLVNQLSAVERELVDYEKQLAEHQANLEEVVPQTGQIRYAQKRVDEAQRLVDRHKQYRKYLTLRSESRRDHVRKECLALFNKGEKCDFSKEYEQYMIEKRMNQAKKTWDARERREEFLKAEGLPLDPTAGAGADATPAKSGH